MSYYNRRQLLLNTLRSLAFSSKVKELEVIITDDASSEIERIDDIPELFEFPIKVIRVEPEEKWYNNPCVPYNMAIREAQGSIIILQNPEVIHISDVLSHIERGLTDENYVICGVYAINRNLTDLITQADYSTPNVWNEIRRIVSPFVQHCAYSANENGWYNHSIYRPSKFHFLTAITKKNMDKLRGFDERYAYGVDRDDAEFVQRIERNKLQIKFIDEATAIHQNHDKVAYQRPDVSELRQRNKDLYDQVTVRETTWAPFNVDKLKVSVIIPFYNRIDYLMDAVNSVLQQTHPNIELIVVNDGSTEDISSVVELCKKRGIKLLHQDNYGAGAARNLGIDNATGEYIAFLDSDDMFLPHKIEKQLLFMINEDYSASHTSYLAISDDGAVKKETGIRNINYPHVIRTCPAATPTLMIKSRLLKENGIYFPEYPISQDTCFMINIARMESIMGVKEAFTKVRIHQQFTAHNYEKSVKGLVNVLHFVVNHKDIDINSNEVLELAKILQNKIASKINVFVAAPVTRSDEVESVLTPVVEKEETAYQCDDLLLMLDKEVDGLEKQEITPETSPIYKILLGKINQVKSELVEIYDQIALRDAIIAEKKAALTTILSGTIPTMTYEKWNRELDKAKTDHIELQSKISRIAQKIVRDIDEYKTLINKVQKTASPIRPTNVTPNNKVKVKMPNPLRYRDQTNKRIASNEMFIKRT